MFVILAVLVGVGMWFDGKVEGSWKQGKRRRGRSSGARVAAILRDLGASGVLSSSESAAAIGAVETKLSRGGVPIVKLGSLAKRALEAHETNALENLASPNG